MAKYRKIALVEAEQFLPPHQIPEDCYQKGTIGDVAHGYGEWFLKTLEGEHGPLRYADYICIGVRGERWNVERSIFESTYEPATPAPAVDAVEGWTPTDAWQELSEYTDRTSPAEYPDMCLITFDELKMFMARPQRRCICGEVEGENDACPLHGEHVAVDAVPAGEDNERQEAIIRNVLYRSKLNGCSADVYDTAAEIIAALSHGEGRK